LPASRSTPQPSHPGAGGRKQVCVSLPAQDGVMMAVRLHHELQLLEVPAEVA
jgi:hypothetical protein